MGVPLQKESRVYIKPPSKMSYIRDCSKNHAERGDLQSFNSSPKASFLLFDVHSWALTTIERPFLLNIKKNKPLLRMISRQLSPFRGIAPLSMHDFCCILLHISLSYRNRFQLSRHRLRPRYRISILLFPPIPSIHFRRINAIAIIARMSPITIVFSLLRLTRQRLSLFPARSQPEWHAG